MEFLGKKGKKIQLFYPKFVSEKMISKYYFTVDLILGISSNE